MNSDTYRQRLELEARLNKISSAAVREPVVDDRSGYRAIQTSVDGVESKNMRDLQVRAQLAKISTNAIVDKLGVRPTKSKSEVTKEMILAYQKEMLEPVVVNGKKLRYHPSSLDLDELAYAPIHADVKTEAEIRGLRNAMGRIAVEVERLGKEYQSTISALERAGRKYDMDAVKIETEYADMPRVKAPLLVELEDQYRKKTAGLGARLEEIRAEIAQNEGYIDQMKLVIDSNPSKLSDNRAEEVRIQRENARRLKAYEEDMNLLNRGKMDVRQEPNESDEDYRERLRQTGQMTVSEDAMKDSSELYYRDILREKCLELVRDTGIISNALKFLTSDQVYQLVKYWPRIKREFIKIYGFDNKTTREVDLIDFFGSSVDPIIEAVNKGKAPPVDLLGREPAEATAVVPTAEVRAPEISVIELESMTKSQIVNWTGKYHNEFSGKISSLTKTKAIQFIIDKGWTDRPAKAPAAPTFTAPSAAESLLSGVVSPALGSSLARRVFSIGELDEKSRQFLADIMKREELIARTSADESVILMAEAKIAAIDSAADALGRGSRDGFYAALDRLERLEPNLVKGGLPDIYPRIEGSGLKPITQDIPSLIEFGKVKISPKRLYYNNVLAIKHKSGKSLGGLPNVQVSEKFVSIIMNLLRGQKPTIKDFSQLDISEKGIYDSLIQIAGLHKDIDNTFGESKQHLKKRLELVEGEIGAGNTNPALKKELHGLLGKMAHSGMIGYGDARKHYLSVTRG